MAGIYHPSRGGVRGGQDQFKWEDVKNDKDKEYYIGLKTFFFFTILLVSQFFTPNLFNIVKQFFLGHSLMVPTGQWTKGKDIFW